MFQELIQETDKQREELLEYTENMIQKYQQELSNLEYQANYYRETDFNAEIEKVIHSNHNFVIIVETKAG